MTMILCSCCYTPTVSKFSESYHEQRQRKGSKRRLHIGLAWLPFSMSAMGIITIIMTYMFAVLSGHLSPVLPYISTTGIKYPESSIFSLCMDIVAFLLVLTVYVAYHLIGQYIQIVEDLPHTVNYLVYRRVNKAMFVVGVVAAIGLSILANFPEDENLLVHLVGAFFLFTFGVAYLFFHTWLSFKTSPEFSPAYMCFARLGIASFSALTYALSVIVFGTALRWHADENNPQLYYKRISAAFEWILVVTFDLYFMTFVVEFRRIQMSHTFQHNQGGSWVEFAQSEETNSTRSAGSSAYSACSGGSTCSASSAGSTCSASSACIASSSLGSSTKGIIDNRTSVGSKNENQNANNHVQNCTDYTQYDDMKSPCSSSLSNQAKGIDSRTNEDAKHEMKSANNHVVINSTDYIRYYDMKMCYHGLQKGVMLRTDEECCIGWATTV